MEKAKEAEAEGRWKDLPIELLVTILGRVGIESLLLSVPFVCKSWHQATLNPLCWEHLIFPETIVFSSQSGYLCERKAWLRLTLNPSFFKSLAFSKFSRISRRGAATHDRQLFLDRFKDTYRIKECSVFAFVKFLVHRSQGKCTLLLLPLSTPDILNLIAQECPLLRTLSVGSCYLSNTVSVLREVIGNWKYLENLALEYSSISEGIISRISNHNLLNLYAVGGTITEREASAIVTNLPNVKYLFLTRTRFDKQKQDRKDNALTMGCKELVHLDVSFSSDLRIDCETIKMAQDIRTFNYDYSRPGFVHVVPDAYDYSYA